MFLIPKPQFMLQKDFKPVYTRYQSSDKMKMDRWQANAAT
jgi:hypothetical protein